jgi:hypothetical protein
MQVMCKLSGHEYHCVKWCPGFGCVFEGHFVQGVTPSENSVFSHDLQLPSRYSVPALHGGHFVGSPGGGSVTAPGRDSKHIFGLTH